MQSRAEAGFSLSRTDRNLRDAGVGQRFQLGASLGTINTGSGSYTLSGLGYASPVENQGGWGTCWDFAGVSSLECKYMLTRNDTSYSMSLSEEQVPMQMGGTSGNFANGGWDSWVMTQACVGGGIVTASARFRTTRTRPRICPHPPTGRCSRAGKAARW